MVYRSGNPGDFQHVETFVWQAIFPAFDHPDLNDAQRASNDAIIETARKDCYEAMGTPQKKIFVAWDERRKELAGFIILDKGPYDYPELTSLIVSRRNWGKGIAPELMKLGLDWLGYEKPVQLGVIHYNERALSFFKRYGFEDTGEAAGDHLIPRVLMLRDSKEPLANEDQLEKIPAVIETWDSTQLETEEEIDALFAEAPNQKAAYDDTFSRETEPQKVSVNEDLTAPPEKKLAKKMPIEFEVDAFVPPEIEDEYIGSDIEEEEEEFTFEFAFDSVKPAEAVPAASPRVIDWEPPKTMTLDDLAPDEPRLDSSMTLDELAKAYEANDIDDFNEEKEKEEEEPLTELKSCINCEEELPVLAKFCLSCGAAQVNQSTSNEATKVFLEEEVETADIEEFTLELPELEPEEIRVEEENEPQEQEIVEDDFADVDDLELFDWDQPLLRQFREQFREKFADVTKRFFGKRKVADFVAELAQSEFQRVIDNALEGLNRWTEGREMDIAVNQVIATLKYQRIAGDLIEYFIVEESKHIHRVAFPQRLLRYQSVEWAKTDLFSMTSDYLDFASETEEVYTDFITLPAKKLKNATQNFLLAGRDERIFFIADLSLTGSLKAGFAFTDSGIYWKNMLQPNHAAFYNEIKTLEMKSDHLLINGHFFDAGKQLNFKVAMLLAKLNRLMP